MRKRLVYLMIVGAMLVGLSHDADAQGQFRVKSITPGDGATGVDRKTHWVTVNFDDGTIDCARSGRGKSMFHLHSVSPSVVDAQSMYEDPRGTKEGYPYYHGHLRCEEAENRLVFATPRSAPRRREVPD